MQFQSHPSAFSAETISVTSAQSLVVFDDQYTAAAQDDAPPRGGAAAARRTSRRPNPVAVPNLTKKARGRAVPTKDTLLKPGSGRAYACPVEDCRKVFTRSEHLKRHTRSIHTNEKREYPSLTVSRP